MCVLGLLAALFQPRLPKDGENPSRFLKVTSQLAAILMFVAVAWNLLRVAISPWLYSQLKEFAAANGHAAPPYGDVLIGILKDLLVVGCALGPPWLVYKTWREQELTAVPQEIQTVS